ncbi:MAG: hypothetical protein ACE5EW_00170 [Thermoplasmata archaeon]
MPAKSRGADGEALLRNLERKVSRSLEGRGDVLQARHTGHWVSFRSRNLRRVFAELRAHERDVEIFLLPSPQELGSDGRVAAAPKTQGWGWFRSRLRLTKVTDLAQTQSLLLRSYEFRARMSREGGRRPRSPLAGGETR